MTADTWSAPAADRALPSRFREIRQIDPASASAIGGVVASAHGLLGSAAFFAMKMALELPLPGRMAGMALALPFLYAVLGVIGGLLSAVIYNLVASTVGGLQLELRRL